MKTKIARRPAGAKKQTKQPDPTVGRPTPSANETAKPAASAEPTSSSSSNGQRERYDAQRRAEAHVLTQPGTIPGWPTLGTELANFIDGSRRTGPARPIELAMAMFEDIAVHAANLGAAILFQNEDGRVDAEACDELGKLALRIENKCRAAADLAFIAGEARSFAAREVRP